MKLQKGPGKDPDFMDQPDDDQAELSSLLEESVESLSATVGGWRSELARSSERSARLEATLASHTAAMEDWKADMASTGAKAEEKLLRALEILESRMAQNQAIASEIREALGSSASLLTKALEEWKAEIRYGSGLTEVKVLSAIESVGGQIGQVKGSVEEWNSGVGESQKKTESRLLKALEKLNESISTLTAAVVKTRSGVEGQISKLSGSVQEWHVQVSSAAVGTEKKLLMSLDALETGIAHSLNARQEIEKRLLIMLEELEMRLSRSQQEGAERQEKLESSVMTLAQGIERLRSDLPEASDLAAAREESEKRQQRLESSLMALMDGIESWRSSVEAGDAAAARQEVENKVIMSLGELETRLSRSQQESEERQERLESSVFALAESIEHWRSNYPEASDLAAARQEIENRLLMSLGELEMRLSRSHQEGGERQERLEGSVMALAESIDDWRTNAPAAADIVSARQEIDNRVLTRLESLDRRVTQSHEQGDERQAQFEKSMTDLALKIDEWREQGSESAGRNKERLSMSLEALETRILENREEAAEHRDKLRKELLTLVSAVDNLRSKERDYARVMRGLEELDRGLLRNREDVAGLVETFEVRLDELERRLLERNNALVTLMLGPGADPEALSSLQDPSPPEETVAPARGAYEPKTARLGRRRR